MHIENIQGLDALCGSQPARRLDMLPKLCFITKDNATWIIVLHYYNTTHSYYYNSTQSYYY